MSPYLPNGPLATIDASDALLVNCLELVRWNLDKTYLRDIEQRGGAIVPSQWCASPNVAAIRAAMEELDTDRAVIKPVIGANAVDTFVIAADDDAETLAAVAAVFDGRRCVVQPFVAGVQTEGEYSLFFFSGELSPAIRKVPKPGDFRVQEEHGADILPVESPAELKAVAEHVVALLRPVPVYARADFVRGSDGRFLLMELELIEPSLYLRTDERSAERFARALDAHCRARRESPWISMSE